MLQYWRRTGHLPSFFFPTPGICQLKNPHPREFAIQGKKNANSRGSSGGGLGAGGIDWCISWDASHLRTGVKGCSKIRRVWAKPRLILDEMCRLYGKFTTYLRRVLCKTRLIFPRINGPTVSTVNDIYEINHIWTAEMKWKWRNDRRSERNLCNCVKKPEKTLPLSLNYGGLRIELFSCTFLPRSFVLVRCLQEANPANFLREV